MTIQTQALIHARNFLRALAAQATSRGRWQAEDPAAAECLRVVEDALTCPPEADDLLRRFANYVRLTKLDKKDSMLDCFCQQAERLTSPPVQPVDPHAGLLARSCQLFRVDPKSSLRCEVCGHFFHQHPAA